MPLFKGENNTVLNQGLDKRGFSTIPLLNSSDIEKLLHIYFENTPIGMAGFHPTMFFEDVNYRKKMNDVIVEVLSDKLKNIISDGYKVLYGNFMVKEPGEASAMKIHQDWTYVDESKHQSFAFWIPLCDLNTENGAFHVVPYSHQADNLQRGPGTHCPFFEYKALIEEKFSKPLYLKAGEAVCWNHKLAHFSPANLSYEPRIAVTVIVVPENADVVHYFKPDSENTLFKYSVDENFYEAYKIGQFPSKQHTLSENYLPFSYSKKHLSELLTPYNVKMIFSDHKLSNQFSKDGFVVLDLLNDNEFQQLETLYFKLFNEYQKVQSNTKSDYDLSFFRQSGDVKKQIFDEMWCFFESKIKQYLPDYEPLIINMFNKQPGTGEVPIHQNWTFVDEDYHTSVSVWIPLCDVSRKNGTLEVIPGTHLNISKFRGPSIPWAFKGMENLLKEKYMQPLELIKGQVSILDDAIIHYSADNHSGAERPTIQLILKPKKAKAIHYHTPDIQSGKLNKYEVDASFFMDFDMKSEKINAPLIETISFKPPVMTEDDLRESKAYLNYVD
jgi:ectoine hydroxylase-related dioxygenase (phytanoyl-CoA dioxygenase family)